MIRAFSIRATINPKRYSHNGRMRVAGGGARSVALDAVTPVYTQRTTYDCYSGSTRCHDDQLREPSVMDLTLARGIGSQVVVPHGFTSLCSYSRRSENMQTSGVLGGVGQSYAQRRPGLGIGVTRLAVDHRAGQSGSRTRHPSLAGFRPSLRSRLSSRSPGIERGVGKNGWGRV